MLDLYGRGYVIEHCLYNIEQVMDERRYRAYVTDVLMVIANNIANGLGGSSISARWVDVYKPQDTRTGEEIAQEVIKNAGLIPKGGEDEWMH